MRNAKCMALVVVFIVEQSIRTKCFIASSIREWKIASKALNKCGANIVLHSNNSAASDRRISHGHIFRFVKRVRIRK